MSERRFYVWLGLAHIPLLAWAWIDIWWLQNVTKVCPPGYWPPQLCRWMLDGGREIYAALALALLAFYLFLSLLARRVVSRPGLGD